MRQTKFIMDRTAIQGPEFPVLVVDLFDEPGRTFHVVPSQIQGVQNNLSIANMDFGELPTMLIMTVYLRLQRDVNRSSE